MKTLEKLIREEKPTVVVFYKRGENDLSKIESNREAIKQQFGDKVEVLDFDCTENGQPKEKYRFLEYPTYILFEQGGELMRLSGDVNTGDLIDMVKRAI